MRLVVIFILGACLQMSAKGLAQTVTITEKEVPLEHIFSLIKKQTGYTFWYSVELLKDSRKVSLSVKEAPLKDALEKCLDGQPLTYEIIGKIIVIQRRESTPVQALPVQVHGVVMDEDGGHPLMGASVRVKGTNSVTGTNDSGIFTLDNVDEEAILVISYIGYQTREIPLKKETALNIFLKRTIKNLDETVVIGYGTTTRRYNTGSVSRVTSKDIEKQPVANVMQALQGLVPGLEIVQSNGYASAQFRTVIRGSKDLFSAGSPNVPLFIVDGVPLATSNGDINSSGLNQNGFLGTNSGQSPLYSINPSDIESIEVLKDADATAIYGSRGANGVILITTKKGKTGRAGVDINAYTGVTLHPRKVDLLNTQQYLAMRHEAFNNDGITPTVSNAPDLVSWDTTRYTDWQKVLAASARTYDMQLSYSGGSDLTNFRLSGGFHKETPPVPDGFTTTHFGDQRLSGMLTLNHSSVDRKFSSALMVNYAVTNNNLAGGSYYQFNLPPDAPSILNAAGKLNWKDWGSGLPYQFQSLFQPYTSQTTNLLTNLSLNYNFFSGFTAALSLGYSTTNMNQLQLVPASSQAENPANATSYAQSGTNDFRNWIIEPRATYNATLGKGKLEALAGATLQENLTQGGTLEGIGFANDDLLENITSASQLYATSNYAKYRFQGYFARLNYNWAGKYILNLSGRRDGSSRFRAADQMGNFGAAGAAWIFSETSWMKRHMSFISFGKLRGSYGATGSASSSDYAYLARWQSMPVYDNTGTISLINPYNPGYQWQVNKKLETAMELGFLNNRILLSVAWYRERCGNQLVNYPLPSYTGFSSVVANLPALVQNKGWEMTLNTTNINTKDLTWSTFFNISINRNKLLSFPGLASSPYNDNYVIGKPVTIQKVLHYTGVDPATGSYQFEDANKDGVISYYSYGGASNDRVGIYDLSPSFFGGLQNTLQYKKWQMSILFDFKKQRGQYAVSNGIAGSMINQPVSVLARWQQPGDITNVAKFSTMQNTPYYNYTNSDARLVDASYIRLQNLSLSYTLPENWSGKARMKTARLYVQAQNLLIISPYKGVDPTNPSLSNYGFPPQRFFTGGVQITF